MKVLGLISNPRSGSTYFTTCFTKFTNCKALYEIWHKKGWEHFLGNGDENMELINHFCDIMKCKSTNLDDKKKNIMKWRDNNKVKFLYIIIDFYKNKYELLAFKIFRSHITDDELHELSKFIDYFHILKRNPIDMFISQEKTTSDITCFENYDTSHIKINFDINKFEIFEKEQTEWINYNKKNENMTCDDYDEIITNSNGDVGNILVYIQNKILNKIDITGVIDKNYIIDFLKKQDKSKDYKDKIINYKSVENYIKNYIKKYYQNCNV